MGPNCGEIKPDLLEFKQKELIMKICIDARMHQESGIGRYIRNLLNNLQKIDKKNHYIVLSTKENFQNIVLGKNFEKTLVDFGWYSVAEQMKMPRLLKKINPDLVHFPHFNVPVFYDGKFVVTIHDLIHQHYQMRRSTTRDPVTYKIKQIGYRYVFRSAAQKSCKILVPSEYVKGLLIKEWNIAGEKIVVTYEACDDKIFSTVNNMNKNQADEILKGFNIHSPFIFYVGNAHPHKNVEGLIKSFNILRKNYQYLQLVLSGKDHYFWQMIKKENQIKNIIFTGEITDEELVVLFKNARCFVMPSFEEGFGLPLLEAMASGCPVVCSDIRVFREVGGEAVLTFNPKNQVDMGGKIDRVITDNELRKDLIDKGYKNYKKFSWHNLTRQTLEVYEQCG